MPVPIRPYLGRLILPLALLAGAAAFWFASNQLGTVERTDVDTATEDASSLPFASVRRVPEFATRSLRSDQIAVALAGLPEHPSGLACTTVIVDGEHVLSVRSDQALVPSYAQLLLTGHAAIEQLGPDFRYQTVVMANDPPDDDGRISGGIYLIGSGDPVFMSRPYALTQRPVPAAFTAVEDLAAAVAAAGVLRIDGGVIGVDRRYDAERTLSGWPEELLARGFAGPLTALQVDDALAERAAANGGVAVPAEEPTVFGVERFVEALDAAGVEAVGFHRALFEEEELPSLVPIARLASSDLATIVRQTLAVNDAGAAELLLKELGVAESQTGTTQAGAQAVQRVLQDQGVRVPVAFRDASGLDSFGGTTCNQLATTADTIASDHPTLIALPEYNLPAVFDGLFAEVPLTSDLRLVGGIEGNASGLVARTVDQGRQVTIASIINRPGGPTEADLAFQQALVEMVDGLRASVTVEALAVDE